MRVTNYQRLSAAGPEPEGGANYQRLSAAGPEPEGGARAGRGAARAWEALRRAAAGVARLYAARRRWAARRLWGGRRAALPLRAKAAAAARYEYDSASYARNFDDGAWMAEEGVSWHARSFGACRLAAVQ